MNKIREFKVGLIFDICTCISRFDVIVFYFIKTFSKLRDDNPENNIINIKTITKFNSIMFPFPTICLSILLEDSKHQNMRMSEDENVHKL